MGGYGSGSRYNSNSTTSDYRSMDIRHWQREGVLKLGCSFSFTWSRNGEVIASIQARGECDRVWLTYRHRRNDGPWKDEHYPVTVEWTPCHFGGSRPWFRCPASGCGQRVAILYGGEIFACRHCHRLAYQSQREAPHGRALSQAQAIRVKLGGSPSLAEPFPPKPKGMHRRTYERLHAKADQAQDRSWPPWLLELMLRQQKRNSGPRTPLFR
jgi:hypothetical protein